MSAVRVILHVDMNSFFASVEQAYNPALKGLPLAVAGNPKERRGILVTCSYEARALGIYTTMTVGEARKICPDLVIVPPNKEKYAIASEAVFTILRSYTELVEPVSIDEGYMDITDIGGLTNAYSIAETIQQRILRELDLPCSIGIAPNKFLAKTASDMKKPMGITILRKRDIPRMLWPLPVINMHGVGKSTEQKLHACNLFTIGDLAKAPEWLIKSNLGKNGLRLWRRANGIDSRIVDPAAAEERKSVGSSTTLPVDETEIHFLLKVFTTLAKKVANRLIEKQLAGTIISIQMRTADWQNHTRSKTLMNPIYREDDIYEEAVTLFQQHWNSEPIRLLGITIGGVLPLSEVSVQLSFENYEYHAKEVQIDELVTKLRKKFGTASVRKGLRER